MIDKIYILNKDGDQLAEFEGVFHMETVEGSGGVVCGPFNKINWRKHPYTDYVLGRHNDSDVNMLDLASQIALAQIEMELLLSNSFAVRVEGTDYQIEIFKTVAATGQLWLLFKDNSLVQ